MKNPPINNIETFNGQWEDNRGKNNLPRGIRNNNPGNLVKTSIPWQGKTSGTDTRFETFINEYWGIRAALKDVFNDYSNKGKKTIGALLQEYAPEIENHTLQYVEYISNNTNVSASTQITKEQIPLVLYVIFKYENGGEYITLNKVQEVWKSLGL